MPTEFLQAYLAATPSQREAAFDELTGRRETVAVAVDERPMPRNVKVRVAEQLTGLTARSLRRLASRGLLSPVYYGGSKRAWGYTEKSVRALLEGAGNADFRHGEREVEVA